MKTLALCLALLAGGAVAQETFSPQEARTRAAQALGAGFPQDTALITQGLLARDPDDVSALILSAHAAIVMGDFETARDHGRRAFAGATDDGIRYQAARVMARAESALGHGLRAQVWLRRASRFAPTSANEDAIARDYRYLRGTVPLKLSVDLSVAPSSNVNNGSAAETIRMPGLPFDFSLSPAARALSGTVATAEIGADYRLAASATSATMLRGQLGLTGVAMSDASRAAAPEVSGSDLSQMRVSAGVVQMWKPGEGLPWSLSTEIGYSTYGGAAHTRYGTIALSHGWDTPFGRLTATAGGDGTLYLADNIPARSSSLSASFTPKQSRLTVSAAARDTSSPSASRDFSTYSLGADYSFGQVAKGVDLAVSASREWRHFDVTPLSFDGRDDVTSRITLRAGLSGFDLYGFHPVIDIEAEQRSSNVNLYDSNRIGVGLGFETSF